MIPFYFVGLLACVALLIYVILNNPNKVEKYDENGGKATTNKKKSSYDKSITDIVPIIGYDDSLDCFMLDDNSYMDIMLIKAKNLADLSDDEKEFMKMKYSRWYKKYGPDLKLIMMNFPSDVSKQRRYWEERLMKTYDPIFRDWQQKKISELKWIEKNRTTREFYFMFWGDTKEQFLKNREVHIESLGTGQLGYIDYLSKNKKEEILFKYNNMCSTVHHKENYEEVS